MGKLIKVDIDELKIIHETSSLEIESEINYLAVDLGITDLDKYLIPFKLKYSIDQELLIRDNI